MFKNLFSKKKETNEKYILIAALLVHAAKIDKMYSDVEKKIIKKAIINLDQSNSSEIDKILEKAEKKEEESNQILEFTKEIKKYSSDFRFKIIEILWEIVYSDGTNDIYESNLIRRVCGLLYVSDKDNGIIKLKVQKKLK
tara:strand:- start:995 stop:1414 length:420 start_codon:yes stop_codon:yes gene_type:complete